MELTQDINIKTLIEDGISRSISYKEYRNLVEELVAADGTTGPNQTEALIEYTKLNDRRMRRWDKTLKVTDKVSEKVSNVNTSYTWLVLTESWCGDAAHVMPAINKVASLNDNIDFKVVLRDENEALMDAFLTNGGRSIPKLIMIDSETKEVVNTFGPRPSEATQMVLDYKEEHGKITPEFKEDLQRWYNKDKGQTAINDLVELLS
ncbi:thioredoxin family protein [Pontimicrobium sp. IMCC45349]|uniref:thioredoxin family protein n=1 Tax=Pontimicrobium sp. IMCC45349 TaxID=3391574 RepID=UPI00399F7008